MGALAISIGAPMFGVLPSGRKLEACAGAITMALANGCLSSAEGAKAIDMNAHELRRLIIMLVGRCLLRLFIAPAYCSRLCRDCAPARPDCLGTFTGSP
ncbi:MAG: hypothetical protein ACXWP6_12375, partial [Ktedonobacterales bacterium]